MSHDCNNNSSSITTRSFFPDITTAPRPLGSLFDEDQFVNHTGPHTTTKAGLGIQKLQKTPKPDAVSTRNPHNHLLHADKGTIGSIRRQAKETLHQQEDAPMPSSRFGRDRELDTILLFPDCGSSGSYVHTMITGGRVCRNISRNTVPLAGSS